MPSFFSSSQSSASENDDSIRLGRGTPLGAFSILPPEIRFNVWHYLDPSYRSLNADIKPLGWQNPDEMWPAGYRDSPNRLAIMQTSHRLHDEVAAELYRREIRFSICPRWARWSVKELPGALEQDFIFTPFERFKSIAVELLPPNGENVRQLARAREMVESILGLLLGFQRKQERRGVPAAGAYLPKIEIKLVENKAAKWYRNGKDQKPILHCLDDMAYILGPFRLLRQIRCVEVLAPPSMKEDDYFLDWVVREIKTSMLLTDKFGTRLHNTHVFERDVDLDDAGILEDEEFLRGTLKNACSIYNGASPVFYELMFNR